MKEYKKPYIFDVTVNSMYVTSFTSVISRCVDSGQRCL